MEGGAVSVDMKDDELTYSVEKKSKKKTTKAKKTSTKKEKVLT